MLKRAVDLAAALVLGTVLLLPLAAEAAMIDPGLSATGRPAGSMLIEKTGCYRMGLSGYRWYRYCAGPYWLYPHRRVCRHHHCWYR